MKKLFCCALLFLTFLNFAVAQTVSKTITKPVAPKTLLKTFNDSVSYSCGMAFANYYKSQGVTNINTTLMSKAVSDVLSGKNVAFNDETANTIMNKYMFKLQEAKSKPAIDSGKKFLAENKKRPNVKTTASGLQYEVITEGTGIKPMVTDSVTCNYKGALLNGVEIDNSYTTGRPITFSLKGVVPGWTEGLQLMSKGSKYKFYIPYNLGYGLFDYGPIPGGSTLVFEIDLLDVKKGPTQ